MVTLALTNPQGKQTIALGTDPSRLPAVRVGTGGPCRVILGDVDRGRAREMSLQLRDKNGRAIWMPQARNALRRSMAAHRGEREIHQESFKIVGNVAKVRAMEYSLPDESCSGVPPCCAG